MNSRNLLYNLKNNVVGKKSIRVSFDARFLCLMYPSLYVQNDFGPSKLFWSCLNRFGCFQIILVESWTRPKQIGPVLNDWYSTKMIWTVQNHFGPIEVKGIRHWLCSIKNTIRSASTLICTKKSWNVYQPKKSCEAHISKREFDKFSSWVQDSL